MLEIIADPAAAAHHMLNPEIGKIMLKLMQRAASHPANIDDE